MRTLDEALASFLRKEKGSGSYAALAQKLGIAESTLYRIIHGEQSVTLRGLESIMRSLHVSPAEIFHDDLHRQRGRRG